MGFTLTLRPRGIVRVYREGELLLERSNLFTDHGRNWLAHLIAYRSLSTNPGANEPAGSKWRYDGVRYAMLGEGGKVPTGDIKQLEKPLAVNAAGDYLKQLTSSSFNTAGTGTLFRFEWGLSEVSFGGSKQISEAGLFVSGAEGQPLDPKVSNHVPIAYVFFPQPIPKTNEYGLILEWEIRF